MKKTGKKSMRFPSSEKPKVEGLSKKPPEESKYAEVASDAKFRLIEARQPKKKGGKRPGAGRPRVAEKRVSITVTLRPADIEDLRKWGGGNVSKVISELVNERRMRYHL